MKQKTAVHESGELVIVCDHDDRAISIFPDRSEGANDPFSGGWVQIAGGLVGENEPGTSDEGASQCDQLLLTSTQLGRAMACPVPDTNPIECVRNQAPTGGPKWHPGGMKQRQLDIFRSCQMRQQE
jgi:hypothetical protein